MKWCVVGAAGMLGQDVVAQVSAAGFDPVALDRDVLDITDAPACLDALADFDVVVNCAAWTAVDSAESHEADAFAVNAVGAANVARAAASTGARLVHISTDYVFSGEATAPYSEDAPLSPRSAYGRTKGAGEWAVRAAQGNHIILRTAWLYGAHGPCFPKTIARLLHERGSVDVVADQVGQPTWTVDVADLAVRLIGAEAPSGNYHATSSGQASWFEFAQAIASAAGLVSDAVHSTTSEAFVRPAPRPAYSVLGHDALRTVGVAPISGWQDSWAQAAPVVLG